MNKILPELLPLCFSCAGKTVLRCCYRFEIIIILTLVSAFSVSVTTHSYDNARTDWNAFLASLL